MAPIPHVRLLLDHRGARSKSPISHQLRVGARVLTANSHCTIVLLETGTGTVSISSPRSLRFAATDRPRCLFTGSKTPKKTPGGAGTHKDRYCVPCVSRSPRRRLGFYTVVSTCTSSSSGALSGRTAGRYASAARAFFGSSPTSALIEQARGGALGAGGGRVGFAGGGLF